MPGNRVLLVIAGGLALTGTASAFSVGAPDAATSLSSAGHTATTLAFLNDELPELELPEFVDTTTTTSPTTTTAAPHVTTTAAPPTTVALPTTVPVTTTTLPSGKKAFIDSIVNHYPGAIYYAIGSDDSSAQWTLAANESGAPATIRIGEHDSSGSHLVAVPTCGRGDQDQYFTAGHHYTIEIVENGLPDACGEGIPGYWSLLHDLTTGTTKTV